MPISLSNSPFIIHPRNADLPVVGSNRSLDEPKDSRQNQPLNDNQRFSLKPEQNQRITGLQINQSTGRHSNNPSISQYLQTQSLAKREALESLVGLDLFV